jgi:hypothetical protein
MVIIMAVVTEDFMVKHPHKINTRMNCVTIVTTALQPRLWWCEYVLHTTATASAVTGTAPGPSH